jgi:hypothetical protein
MGRGRQGGGRSVCFAPFLQAQIFLTSCTAKNNGLVGGLADDPVVAGLARMGCNSW